MWTIKEALHGMNNIVLSTCSVLADGGGWPVQIVRTRVPKCTVSHMNGCLFKNPKSHKRNWLLYRQNSQNVPVGSCAMKLLGLQMLACLLSGELTWNQYGETKKTICRGVVWVSHTAGLLVFFCGACSCDVIWSAWGQRAIQCTERRMNKYTYNYMHNFNCLFLQLICN
jgi:hypothetical protein